MVCSIQAVSRSYILVLVHARTSANVKTIRYYFNVNRKTLLIFIPIIIAVTYWLDSYYIIVHKVVRVVLRSATAVRVLLLCLAAAVYCCTCSSHIERRDNVAILTHPSCSALFQALTLEAQSKLTWD